MNNILDRSRLLLVIEGLAHCCLLLLTHFFVTNQRVINYLTKKLLDQLFLIIKEIKFLSRPSGVSSGKGGKFRRQDMEGTVSEF